MSVESRPIRLSATGKAITVAIVIALFILLVRQLGNVATPFVAGAITAYLFNPLITWLNRRTGVGRGVWIGLLYIVIGLLFYGLVRFLGPVIAAQYRGLVALLPEMINNLQQQLLLVEPVELGGIELDIAPLNEQLRDFVIELGRRLPEQVPHLFATAFESLILFVSYLVITFYLLQHANQIVESAYNLVPAPYRDEIRSLGRQIDDVLSGYIRGVLLLIPIMSVLTYIALSLMGIRYALVLAIFSGIVETIPLLGPWTAALTSITVALFQTPAPFGWPHWLVAAVIGLIYFVLRMFEDAFIIPNVVGPAVHLHPMIVIFAILAGGALGGAFGLFISIPLAAIVRLLLRYFYYKLIDRDPPPPPPDHTPPARAPVEQQPAEVQAPVGARPAHE